MTDYVNVVLDELVPSFGGERGDWEAVVADARRADEAAAGRRRAVARIALGRRGGRHPSTASPTARRVVIIATVVAAIAIPLVALAASQNWWFFRFGDAPTPVTGVNVVKTGTWDGKEWQLLAYRSSTDGICFGITPAATARTTGESAGLACDAIEGVPRTPESKPYISHAITFMAGSSENFPAHIVGPVIETADEVKVYLDDGTSLRTPTFAAPQELGSAIRFFVARLPESPRPEGQPPRLGVQKLVGLAAGGRIVACLVLPIPEQGVPLSACR